MELNKVKELASKVMEIGKNRVKITNPEEAREVMTREDVKAKVEQGAITKKPEKGTSKGRARDNKKQKKKGRKKGEGKKKGKKGARKKSKRKWIEQVRAQRKKLKGIKPELKEGEYRNVYRKIKGGQFDNKRQLMNYIEERELMKSD